MLEAVTSGLNGDFSISTLDKSDITLEVSMLGYNPTVIMIGAGNKNVALGNIYLSEE